MFSQDTLVHKSGERQAVKVTEVGVNDIKYHRYDNLTGPQYIINKQDVRFIRYANGTVDTIVKYAEIKPQVISPSVEFQVMSSKSKSSLMYNNISDRDLLYTIQTLPLSDSKNKMLKEYSKMMDYKRTQYLANGLGFGIGFAVPVVVTYLTLSDYNYFSSQDGAAVIVGGALVGAAIRITGQVLTKMNKNKRLNAKRNVIMLYDNLN
ncbi:MAG: hypothetical protein IPJ32_13750 [Sphingobacteriaceae bacterium]|nr:hypothetical protein [Sphingobacteriaceae bacterium]